MGRYTVHLVGESNYQAAIARLSPGDPVAILPEPENRFDPRALRCADITGATLGYVERDSWLTRAVLDDGTPVSASVEQIIGGESGKPSLGVVLAVLTGADAQVANAPASPPQPVPAPARPAAPPPLPPKTSGGVPQGRRPHWCGVHGPGHHRHDHQSGGQGGQCGQARPIRQRLT